MGPHAGIFFGKGEKSTASDLFSHPVSTDWDERGPAEHIQTGRNRNCVRIRSVWPEQRARIATAMYVELPAAREHYFSEIDLSARAGTEQQSDSVPTRKQHQLKSVVGARLI